MAGFAVHKLCAPFLLAGLAFAAPEWRAFPVEGTRILPGPGQSLWAGYEMSNYATATSIKRLEGNTWVNHDMTGVLGKVWLRSLAADGGGHLWFGDTDRVVRTLDDAAGTWDRAALNPPGSAKDSMLVVEALAGEDTSMFAAIRIGKADTKNRQILIFHYDGKTWTSEEGSPIADGLLHPALSYDGAGGVWFAGEPTTFTKGIMVVHHDTQRLNVLTKFLAPADWYDIASDGPKHAWLATSNGLFYWDGGNWIHQDSSIIHQIKAYAVAAANGEAWLGGEKGISHFHDGHWDLIPTKETGLDGGPMLSITVIGETVWFKTMTSAASFGPRAVAITPPPASKSSRPLPGLFFDLAGRSRRGKPGSAFTVSKP